MEEKQIGGDVSIKVALVGLGHVAEAHLAAYKDNTKVDVIAAVEPVESRLAEMADQYEFRGYTDLETMLQKEAPDVACVLTPVNTHRQVTELCAARGVHVLCEKPIAISLEDAERMVSACARNGVKFCYGSSYRYLPAVVKARELIASGALGDIQLMTEAVIGGNGFDTHIPVSFEHYPEGGPGGSGMGLVDHGIHLIDIFPWLVNSEIVGVTGRGNISGASPLPEYAHIDLANGAVVQLLYDDCTFSSVLPAEGIFSEGAAWNVGGYELANVWHENPCSMHIYGSLGTLRIFQYANQLFLRDCNGLKSIPVSRMVAPVHFAKQMESFAREIESGKQLVPSGEDGLKALRILLAIYESAETGKLIEIDNEAGSTSRLAS